MSDRVEFETPENVLVTYQPAGLGTRFIAWVLDYILLLTMMFVLIIVIIIGAVASHVVDREMETSFGDIRPGHPLDLPFYFLGLLFLAWGFCNFLYFGLSEYLTGGQTLGKRWLAVRVVKANGFSLDAGSVLMRNIFRVIDHIPIAWIVPVLSKKSQRLGDMVAGTVVVSDAPAKMNPLRERLLNRNPTEAVFRFDSAALLRVRPQDTEAVEKLLERWYDLSPALRELNLGRLLQAVVEPLARRLNAEPPEAAQRIRFLEDFMAAEYRRQYRHLG